MDGSLTPLQFPVAEPPPPGKTLAIAPGVHWLRMPLPFALDHINLWLLEDGPVHAVKIGMLAGAEQVRAVAAALLRHRVPNVVLDPVLASTGSTSFVPPANRKTNASRP